MVTVQDIQAIRGQEWMGMGTTVSAKQTLTSYS